MRRALAIALNPLPALLIAVGGLAVAQPSLVQGGLAAAVIAVLAGLPLHLSLGRGMQAMLAAQLGGLLLRLVLAVAVVLVVQMDRTGIVSLAGGLALGLVLDAVLVSLLLRGPHNDGGMTPSAAVDPSNREELRA